MEVNIYQAPEADLSKPEIEDSQFYVVSRLKFLTLFFITLGLYEIYWHSQKLASLFISQK